MQEHKMMTVITKSTTPEEWKAAAGTGLRMQSVSVCTGTNVMFDPDAPDWAHNEKSIRDVPGHQDDNR